MNINPHVCYSFYWNDTIKYIHANLLHCPHQINYTTICFHITVIMRICRYDDTTTVVQGSKNCQEPTGNLRFHYLTIICINNIDFIRGELVIIAYCIKAKYSIIRIYIEFIFFTDCTRTGMHWYGQILHSVFCVYHILLRVNIYVSSDHLFFKSF